MRRAALDALSRRDCASEALRRKLIDKGYDPAMVGDVIDRLRDEKLVDDRRYVENFVAYHATRGQGPLRQRVQLCKLGIPVELVDERLNAYPDWQLELRKAQHKKFGTAPAARDADIRRQARFLSYRGFTGAQIRIALGFDPELESFTEDYET